MSATTFFAGNTVHMNSDPNAYGGNQNLYLTRSNAIIRWGVETIQEAALHEGGDGQQLFYTMLKAYEAARGKIAEETQTKDAEEFGRRRTEAGAKKAHYYTVFDKRYEKYAFRIGAGALQDKKYTHEGIQKEDLDYYRQTVEDAREDELAAATIYIDFGDSRIPGAEYIAKKGEKPIVLVRHMDKKYIDTCLKDIAALFEKIVKMKSPKASELKGALCEFRRKFAYCMPAERGSAAVGEWVEASIARAHGYRLTADKNTMIDCEAFASPDPTEFAKIYDSMVTLEPLPK